MSFGVISLMLLILCFCGLCVIDKYCFKLKYEIVPLHVCSCMVCILFLFGLAHMMPEGVAFLVLLGIIGIVLGVAHHGTIFTEVKANLWKIGLLCVAAGYLLWKLCDSQGVMFAWSNFSHYALIVKYLLKYNVFPNGSTTFFDFYGYPPGTALFIYFGGVFLGNSALCMTILQTFLGLSAVLPLLVFGKVSKFYQAYIFIIVGIYYVCAVQGNRIEELMVDTILVVLVTAGFIISTYYLLEKEKAIISLMPILTLIVLVKNSGIYFALFIFVYWLIAGKHSFKSWVYFLIPSGSLLVWNIHTKIAFLGQKSGENVLGVTYWKKVFGEKSISDITALLCKFIDTQITFNNKQSYMFFWFLLWTALIVGLTYKIHCRVVTVLNCVLLIMYVGYQGMLLMMYFFSFNSELAQAMSSYNRYNMTALMILYGGMVIEFLAYPDVFKIKKRIVGYICILMFLTLMAGKGIRFDLIGTKRDFMKENGLAHQHFEDIKNTFSIEENLQQNIIVYVSEEMDTRFWSTAYLEKVAKYVFWSEHVKIVTKEIINDLWDGKVDYVIVYIPDDLVIEQLQKMEGLDTSIIICNWKENMENSQELIEMRQLQ